MVTIEDDKASLANLRNQVLYGNYKNSLVEWTLSQAWTNPDTKLMQVRGSCWRGLVRVLLDRAPSRSGTLTYSVRGEFQCR